MDYLFWYKIISLLVGLTIICLGYLLFLKGVFNESGDIDARAKDYKLIVKKAAPGTYFVLFGSLIIALTIFKGLTWEELLKSDRNFKATHYVNPCDSIPIKDSIKIK